jgi:hypothetical protein
VTDPDIRWTEIFMTVGRKFAQISLFRRLAKSGILQSVPKLFNDNDAFLRYLESEESGWVIPDPGAVKDKRQEMLAALTETNVKTADAAVDAACLVFAHSVVDAIVSDVIRLVADIAPEEWIAFLENRKASLKDVRDGGFDKVYSAVLDNYIEELSKEALSKRIAVLMQKCQPCPEISMPPDHKAIVYDKERLERLDKMRQEIIHRIQTEQAIPNLDDELEYMRQVCLYVLMIARHRFKIEVKLENWLSQRAKTLAPKAEAILKGSNPS